jgi:hypothetical protein
VVVVERAAVLHLMGAQAALVVAPTLLVLVVLAIQAVFLHLKVIMEQLLVQQLAVAVVVVQAL